MTAQKIIKLIRQDNGCGYYISWWRQINGHLKPPEVFCFLPNIKLILDFMYFLKKLLTYKALPPWLNKAPQVNNKTITLSRRENRHLSTNLNDKRNFCLITIIES